MKYKVGDKLKVKKGCEKYCGSYRDNDGKYIKITRADEFYRYNIFNQKGDIINNCSYCFKDEHLEPFEKTLEELEVGDLLEIKRSARPYYTKVLAVVGKIVFLSNCSFTTTGDDLESYSNAYTIHELKQAGYKPYTPITEIHELTIADVAKLKGVDPSQIKIVE